MEMTKENVRNNIYPYTTEVYAAVRSDIDRNSTAYELFEFLTTPDGQDIINESGYVPLNQNSGVKGIYDDETIVSTRYTDLNGVSCNKPCKGIMLKTNVYRNGRSESSKILVE